MINVVTVTAKLCDWPCSIQVELPSMSLGLLSHCTGCLNKSSVAGICVVMFQSENGASLLIGLLDPSSATK